MNHKYQLPINFITRKTRIPELGYNSYLMEDQAQERHDRPPLQFIRKLGRGCQAEVYQVRHAHTGQHFAVKVVETSLLTHKEKQRVEFEVSSNFLLTQKIASRRFPLMHGFWKSEESINILFELCQQNAESGFKQLGSYNQRYNYLIVLLFDVLMALSELQDLNIIHRDIKPENILLRDGLFKLGDLGLSRLTDSTSSHFTNDIGNRLGWSPQFLSGSYTYKTDVWSLGVNIFYMLENTLPFDEESLLQIRNNPNDIEKVISSPTLSINLQAAGRRSKNILSFLHIVLSEMIVIDPCSRNSSSQLLQQFFCCGRDQNSTLKELLVGYLRARETFGEFYLILLLGQIEFYRMEGKIREEEHSNKRKICLLVKNTVLKVVKTVSLAFDPFIATFKELQQHIQQSLTRWGDQLNHELDSECFQDIEEALQIYRIAKVREKFPLVEWMVKLCKVVSFRARGEKVSRIHLWEIPLELYKLI